MAKTDTSAERPYQVYNRDGRLMMSGPEKMRYTKKTDQAARQEDHQERNHRKIRGNHDKRRSTGLLCRKRPDLP